MKMSKNVTMPAGSAPGADFTRPLRHKQTGAPEIIIRCSVNKVRHDRDFGRIEAWVTLMTRSGPTRPAHVERVLANVPARDRSDGRPLRTRLIEDAARTARLLEARNAPAQHVHAA